MAPLPELVHQVLSLLLRQSRMPAQHTASFVFQHRGLPVSLSRLDQYSLDGLAQLHYHTRKTLAKGIHVVEPWKYHRMLRQSTKENLAD